MPTLRFLVASHTVLVALLFPSAGAAQPREDAHGDPLPPGAIGRLGSTRLRHSAYVKGLTFLPDGKTLAAAGVDGIVRLWDVATGKERLHYDVGLSTYGPPDIAAAATGSTVAFSPNRRLVATDDGRRFSLFDAATGKRCYPSGPVAEPGGRAYSDPFCFSGDGRILVRAYRDLENVCIDLYNARAGMKLYTLRSKDLWRHHGVGLTPSPDGKRLVTTMFDSFQPDFDVWDLRRGRHLYKCQGYGVIFAPNGKTLAVFDCDTARVVLRVATTGKKLHTFYLDSVRWVVFAPDGKTLAIADRYAGKVRLWHLPSYREMRSLEWSDELLFSRDGRRQVAVIHSAEGKTASERMQLVGGQEVFRVTLPRVGHQEPYVLSDDGRTLAASNGNTIRLWDVATGKEQPECTGHHSGVIEIALAPDGRQIATAGTDGVIHRWDGATQSEVARYQTKGYAAARLAFGPDAKTLVSYAAGSHAREDPLEVWNVPTGGAVAKTYGPWNSCAWAVTPDGQSVAWGSADGVVRLINLKSGVETRFQAPPSLDSPHWRQPGTFAPDGRRLAVIVPHQSIVASGATWQWDLCAGRPLPTLAGMYQPLDAPLAYTPDGRMLAGMTCTPNRYWQGADVRLWEAVTGQECLRIEQPGEAWHSIAFARDGRRLAVGAASGSVYLWDIAAGKRLARLDGHQGAVHALRFSTDGKKLYSGSADTTVLIWDATRIMPQRFAAAADLEAAWADLAASEAAQAYRAVWRFAEAPKQAIPFFAGHLKPVPDPDDAVIRKWIAGLDSDDFDTRQRAYEELERLDGAVEPALIHALRASTSLEVRRRLQRLLQTVRGVPPADTLRTLRGVQALESIATVEARAALETLAAGAAGARLTREAKEALDRLGQRPRSMKAIGQPRT